MTGQLAHAWASTANNHRVTSLTLFSCAQLAMHTLCKFVTWWCQEVVGLKAGLLTMHFRSCRRFCWFGLWLYFTLKTFYMHKNLNKTLVERIRTKNTVGLLWCLFNQWSKLYLLQYFPYGCISSYHHCSCLGVTIIWMLSQCISLDRWVSKHKQAEEL